MKNEKIIRICEQNLIMKQIRIKPHSEEWFSFRYENGYGGSEIASVLSQYNSDLSSAVWTSALKMHLLKIGEPIQEFTGNVSSESGQYMENVILHYFKHFDLENPDQMKMFKNIKENNPQNKIIAPKSFLVNKNYPWLYYSPDAIMYEGGEKVALVECKLTNSMEAKRYVNRVSPSFVLQVMQGMMISGLDRAYICILVDGIYFEVIPVVKDAAIFEYIRENSLKSWLNVLKARKIKIEHDINAYYGCNPDFFSAKQRKAIEELMSLEPSPSGTDTELDFIKDMIVPTQEYSEMEGTDEQWIEIIKYTGIKEEIKKQETQVNIHYSNLIRSLGGYHQANFEDGKYFSYKPNKNGKSSLYISPSIYK
jgi:hypothetical protein